MDMRMQQKCSSRVDNSPSRLACRSCLPFRISSSICRVRATLSSSRTSLRLAIRARNWSTDSDPSLLPLMLAKVVVVSKSRSTSSVQTAIDGKREDSRSSSTNVGSEMAQAATQLYSAMCEDSLLSLLTKRWWIRRAQRADGHGDVDVGFSGYFDKKFNRLTVVVKALRRNQSPTLVYFTHCGHSEHDISTIAEPAVLWRKSAFLHRPSLQDVYLQAYAATARSPIWQQKEQHTDHAKGVISRPEIPFRSQASNSSLSTSCFKSCRSTCFGDEAECYPAQYRNRRSLASCTTHSSPFSRFCPVIALHLTMIHLCVVILSSSSLCLTSFSPIQPGISVLLRNTNRLAPERR